MNAWVPTAAHVVLLTHDTADNVFNVWGFGVATSDQAVPSQPSTTELVCDSPTAKQFVGPAHATPCRLNGPEIPRAALIRDQPVPSQCAKSAADSDATLVPPTAKQLVTAGHATPDSSDTPGAVGLVTTDHAAPSRLRDHRLSVTPGTNREAPR